MDYGARWYSQSLGRFIQPDTIIPDLTNSQAWNRYSYVLNSPILYVDPSGHYMEQACGFGGGECGTEGALSNENLGLDKMDKYEENSNVPYGTGGSVTLNKIAFAWASMGVGIEDLEDDYAIIYFKPPSQTSIINNTYYDFSYPQYNLAAVNSNPVVWGIYAWIVFKDVGLPLIPKKEVIPDGGNVLLSMTYNQTYTPSGESYIDVTSVAVTNMSEMIVQAHGFISAPEFQDRITGSDEYELDQQVVGVGNSVNFPFQYSSINGVELIFFFHDISYSIYDSTEINIP